MNSVQLFLPDGRQSGVFFCGKCRIVHRTEFAAEDCCAPRICSCGASIPRSENRTVCLTCREAKDKARELARFEAAEKIDASNWFGAVYVDSIGYNEGYFHNVDWLSEHLDDMADEEEEFERPTYAFACSEIQFANISIEDVLAHISEDENTPEDFSTDDLDGLDELETAVEVFNLKNAGKVSYVPDYKKAIILNR